ncbi:MAG: 2-amino-4-hydroxy-6-hydroxymethyldihydropteridine diphosphokinase [Candidatus Paceibacterota bacterium]
MNNKHTIYLALGTNIGDREKNIKEAVVLLQEKIEDMKIAPLYESRPQGYSEQENFLNSVLVGQTDLPPQDLLLFVKNIEKKLGREERIRNGPREIDLDILFYDDLVLNTQNLVIPHPRIPERDFVLLPLVDLAESFIHPLLKISLKSLLNNVCKERYVVGKSSYTITPNMGYNIYTRNKS